ncbi:MAG: phage major capsid protein, partial [Pseudomonadota bacterium]
PITSATNDAAGSVGDAIVADRQPGVDLLPRRRMTIRNLLAPGQTESNLIEYIQETGFSNNAAPTEEGGAKPQSDIKFELLSAPVRTIPHTMKASKQVLSDVSQLRSMIDGALLYGLDFAEELQLLNGDGTGQNLNGLVTQATAYSAPLTIADATPIDNLRLASLQAVLAEYPASGIVLHPTDWAWIELQKDGDGRYIIGNPQGTLSPTMWSLPVVSTQAMETDKFLVGAFGAAQIFDRWESRIEVGYENDDFTKNMVTILAEKRLAMAVRRPEAFIFGDFGRVA